MYTREIAFHHLSKMSEINQNKSKSNLKLNPLKCVLFSGELYYGPIAASYPR